MYSSENMKNKFSFKSVLILLGILLVAAVTALLLFSDLFLSPKKRVENGVMRTLALSTDSLINNGASGKGLLANKALLDSYKFTVTNNGNVNYKFNIVMEDNIKDNKVLLVYEKNRNLLGMVINYTDTFLPGREPYCSWIRI